MPTLPHTGHFGPAASCLGQVHSCNLRWWLVRHVHIQTTHADRGSSGQGPTGCVTTTPIVFIFYCRVARLRADSRVLCVLSCPCSEALDLRFTALRKMAVGCWGMTKSCNNVPAVWTTGHGAMRSSPPPQPTYTAHTAHTSATDAYLHLRCPLHGAEPLVPAKPSQWAPAIVESSSVMSHTARPHCSGAPVSRPRHHSVKNNSAQQCEK